ncbi:MAG: NERD domain-containing protein [Agriterribacter sp.]
MTSKITIYTGSPIEYESEKRVFQTVINLLQKMNREALLIANVHIDKTQIDLIVVLEKKYFVIEVKGTQREIKGGVNGTWLQRTSLTTWAPVRNYYEQAMKAGYVVKDHLSKFFERQVSYPHTRLLFAPGLNPASQIPNSDFKVSIVSFPESLSFSVNAEPDGCTIQDWKKFLAAQHIHPVATTGAALDPQLYHNEQLLKIYNQSVIETYKDDIAAFVPITGSYDDSIISLEEMTKKVTDNKNLLIAGPSGCSKTILAKWMVVQLASKNRTVIYLQAKYFNSLLRPLLDDEIKLLGAPSASVFFDACKKLEEPLTVVIDGYNECSHEKQKRIDRCLVALCFRYTANVILVSQDRKVGLSGLNLEVIDVQYPDHETKKRIAAKYGARDLTEKLNALLWTATSGIEAMIIGKMGVHKISRKSKFALFDYYVRQRLGANASEGTKLLSLIANYLTNRVSFVFSSRELDELIAEENMPPGLIDTLVNSKLLTRYFDKLSFGHELFLHTYMADNITRTLGNNANELVNAMDMPINRNSRIFLIGAIDDEAILANVLEAITDPQLIVEIYLGEAGEAARSWTVTRYVSIFKDLATEVQELQFSISNEEFRNISIVEGSMNKWSSLEAAFIYAIPELLLHGFFFEQVFKVAGMADAMLEREFARLRPEAKEKNIAIRSDLFAAIYCPIFYQGCGLSRIISSLSAGLISLRMHNRAVPVNVVSVVNLESWSNGRLYTALVLARFNEGLISLFPVIYHCLTKQWKYLPYHLKIELLDRCEYFGAYKKERLQLVDAIRNVLDNNNPMINSIAFDVLSNLGAFETEEKDERTNVDFQLQRIFNDRHNPESWSDAAGIFYAHFDHPFSGAYSKAIYELSEADRKEFMIMVVKGIQGGLFTTSAIVALAKFNDPEVANYLYKFIEILPKETSHMPQEDLAVYMLVHCILGQFRSPINTDIGRYSSISDNALSATGIIHYWINRNDLTSIEIEENCEQAWSFLEQEASRHTIDILYQSFLALRNHDIGFNLTVTPLMSHDIFPDRIAAICRHAIDNAIELQALYQWKKGESVFTHAITFLGTLGNQMDIPLLKKFVNHPEFGRQAINAIKKLQENSLN